MSNDIPEEQSPCSINTNELVQDLTFSRDSFVKKFLNKLTDKRHITLVLNHFDFASYFSHKAYEVAIMNKFSQSVMLRMTSNTLPQFTANIIQSRNITQFHFDQTKAIFNDLAECLASSKSVTPKQQQTAAELNCVNSLNQQMSSLYANTQSQYSKHSA